MIPAHLSILHFDKKKRSNIYKQVTEVLVIAVCIMAMNYFLKYILVEDDGFTKMVMRDFYRIEENIDNIYLGSSHVHYDIQPEILDEINGRNNFNLSTGLQPVNTSYFLLKEADHDNQLSHVYLEMYYGIMTGEYGKVKEYQNLPNTWRALDYAKPSINKIEWMLDASSPEYYYLTFIPARRYYKEFLDKEYIAGQIKAKSQFSEEGWNGGYRYKGYRWTDAVIDGMYCDPSKESALGDAPLTEDVKKYLIKIFEYCNENNIKLTLFSSPVADCELILTGDYDNYVYQVSKLAKEYRVSYLDFNLCKKEYLDLDSDEKWRDLNHLNENGSTQFSAFIGKVFLEEEQGIDVQKYFYDSYEEKILSMGNSITGFYLERDYENETDDEQCFRINTINTGNEYMTIKYRVSLAIADEDECVLQEWSENSSYKIPRNLENASVIIEAKVDDQTQENQSYKRCKIAVTN